MSPIYPRMLAYVVTIVLHVGNIAVMSRTPPDHLLEDVRLRTFCQLRYRYLTCWTFVLQVVYAVSALSCDVLSLCNSEKKDYRLPKYLRGFRDTLFSAIVWPSSVLVFLIFWPLFIYDRSLVFPDFLDKVFSPVSNHIMHTAVLPIALWEVVFQPRRKPRSHVRYVAHLVFHLALYLSVLIYTYVERGVWLYPIIKEIYGTILFPLFLAVVLGLALFLYAIQWPLVTAIWTNVETTKKKVR